MNCSALVLAVAMLDICPQQASAVPRCDASPCVVAQDMGGVLKDYFDLVDRVLRSGTTVEIAGDCYSACTVLADQARPNVCLRPEAAMHVHQAFVFQGAEKGKLVPVI